MNKINIFIVVLFFISIELFTQEFTATVNRNPVSVGERFQVTFTLKNSDGSNFKGPDFKGFTVLSGPNQSQSIQIINAQRQSSVAFSYILSAEKAGDYVIGSAAIQNAGKLIKSEPIKLKILPESEAQKQKRQQEQNNEKSLSDQAENLLKKNVFVKLNLSKKDVYRGEQITATYKLYINPDLNVLNMNPSKIPSFNGFWAQDLNIQKLNWTRETLNGVTYSSAIIKQVVLFPQKSGRLETEPYEFEFLIRLRLQGQRKSNDIFDRLFDDPFFGGSYRDFPYKAKSEIASINVKELPPNPPNDFNGAVGNLTLESWLDKTRTKTNDPVTLKVKISGRGNLKLIQPLQIQTPPGFELYDPKTTDNISLTENGMTGTITFEYLLLPRTPGNFKINPVKFSYFNLESRKYIELSGNTMQVYVEKGTDEVSNQVTGIKKEEVQLIGKDIRFIKTNNIEITTDRRKCLGSPMFYMMLILPIILFVVFVLFRKKHLELRANNILVMYRSANKVAKQRLKAAKHFMRKHQKEQFYEEITKALWNYISYKLAIPNAELTKDKVRESLEAKNVSEDIINKLITTLDNSEFARYAPSAINIDLNQIYNEAVSVISEIEGVLK